MALLEIQGLSKRYGTVKAVEGLDLSVEKGSIFGFLGLNGAGKTTTLRMITGLSRPTAGSILVCGEKVRFGSSSANRHIGFLPDVPAFYGFMTPAEYLSLCGRLYGMSKARIAEKTKELLSLVGLDGVHRRIGGFSRGMKQRLGIAQALIHSPELLLLDEPTSALDPVGRREILTIIGSLKGRVTVVFSTHILSDVERVCDTVGILQRGRLALSGPLGGVLSSRAGHIFTLRTLEEEKIPLLKDKLAALPFVQDIREKDGDLLLSCSDPEQLCRLICPLMAGLNIPLSRFEKAEPRLEDVFIEVIRHA